jgi:hypothetical protein
MVDGWAYITAAMEKDGWLAFSGVERKSKGYIAQEIDLLMSEAKHLYTKQP